MKRLAPIFVVTGVALLFSAAPAAARPQAQSTATPARHKLLLRATVKPGEILRYELEAAGSFLPISDASGAILTPARGPCDYALAAIVTLRPLGPDKDGNILVEARYSETRVTSVRCSLFSEADFEKRVAALQSYPVLFRVGPHGETAITKIPGSYFKYWDGG